MENKRRDREHGVMKEGRVETNEDADRVSNAKIDTSSGFNLCPSPLLSAT